MRVQRSKRTRLETQSIDWTIQEVAAEMLQMIRVRGTPTDGGITLGRRQIEVIFADLTEAYPGLTRTHLQDAIALLAGHVDG